MPKPPRALVALLLVASALAAMAPAGAACAAPPAPAAQVPAVLVDTYLALREVAFSTHSEDVDVQARPGDERAYGVIVESWQGGQIVTVVAFASGDASLYYSNGGGLIGGRREPLVASAAGSIVADAQVQLADVPLVKPYPTPDPGSVAVYVLTTAGLRGVRTPQGEIAGEGRRLHRLYADAQKIVSEFHAARP